MTSTAPIEKGTPMVWQAPYCDAERVTIVRCVSTYSDGSRRYEAVTEEGRVVGVDQCDLRHVSPGYVPAAYDRPILTADPSESWVDPLGGGA